MDKQRLIALLRGINVGRAKRVAMADLRKVLSDMGYSDVRTLLNSGNVVFDCNAADAADCAARIEEALVLKLGVPAKVTVIEATQLAEIVNENSLQNVADDHSRLLVASISPMKTAASWSRWRGRAGSRRRLRWAATPPISGARTGCWPAALPPPWARRWGMRSPRATGAPSANCTPWQIISCRAAPCATKIACQRFCQMSNED